MTVHELLAALAPGHIRADYAVVFRPSLAARQAEPPVFTEAHVAGVDPERREIVLELS